MISNSKGRTQKGELDRALIVATLPNRLRTEDELVEWAANRFGTFLHETPAMLQPTQDASLDN